MSAIDTGQNTKDASPVSGTKGQAEQEVLQQRIGRDCIARVLFQGRLTQEAIDRLIKYLELTKDTLPSEKGHLAEIGAAIAQ
jgi:hypothetical protein